MQEKLLIDKQWGSYRKLMNGNQVLSIRSLFEETIVTGETQKFKHFNHCLVRRLTFISFKFDLSVPSCSLPIRSILFLAPHVNALEMSKTCNSNNASHSADQSKPDV